MKTYSVLYAHDVPHYATVEIQAATNEEAISAATSRDTAELAFEDPDWNNPVIRRIVHILDGNSIAVARDISLDEYSLRSGGESDRKLCEASAGMLRALQLAKNPHWVHNAGITDDIEALRKICIYYADWWNSQAWPLIRDLSLNAETQGVAA
jgi:hypothetical protein